MNPRYVLIRFDSEMAGDVIAAGSELAVEAARRLLIEHGTIDCACAESILVNVGTP